VVSTDDPEDRRPSARCEVEADVLTTPSPRSRRRSDRPPCVPAPPIRWLSKNGAHGPELVVHLADQLHRCGRRTHRRGHPTDARGSGGVVVARSVTEPVKSFKMGARVEGGGPVPLVDSGTPQQYKPARKEAPERVTGRSAHARCDSHNDDHRSRIRLPGTGSRHGRRSSFASPTSMTSIHFRADETRCGPPRARVRKREGCCS